MTDQLQPHPEEGNVFLEAEAMICADGTAMVAVAQRLDPRPALSIAALTADHETPALIAIGRYRLAFPGVAGLGERRLLAVLSEKRALLLIEAEPELDPRMTHLTLAFPPGVDRS